MALDYAGLSLRLGRYDLFARLEATWIEHWPISRTMGKQLAEIVRLKWLRKPRRMPQGA